MEVYIIGALATALIVVLVLFLFVYKNKNSNQNYDLIIAQLKTEINNIVSDRLNVFFQNNNEQFKALNKEVMEGYLKGSEFMEKRLKSEFERLLLVFNQNQEKMESFNKRFNESEKLVVATINERLDKVNQSVEQRLENGFKKTNDTFQSVIERLAKIDEAQKNIEVLSTDIISLQDILNDKKSRGSFGEMQLEFILENSFGENNKHLYEVQKTLSNKMIVDAIIHIPEPNGSLSIDSKFPLENYRIMYDQSLEESERKQAKGLFKTNLKKHIDEISKKYIIDGETSKIAVMFIPSEAVFAEVNANYQDIISEAHSKNVIITSPSTLLALINIVLFIIRDHKRNKHAKEIFVQLEQLGKEFARYNDRWQELQKSINRVTNDVKGIDITTNKITTRFNKIANVQIEDDEDISDNTLIPIE